MLTLIHTSDLHFHSSDADNRIVVNKMLSIQNEEFLSNQESHLLLTGDLTDDGHTKQYSNLTRAMSMFPQRRCLVCPGNHDYGSSGVMYYPECADRFDIFAQRLGFTRNYKPKLPIVRVLTSASGRRLMTIGINANVETIFPLDLSRGEVGVQQRQYLSAILDNPDAVGIPKLVYLHHHPFERGFGLELKDSGPFLDCIDGKVDVLCFGHKHKQKIFGSVHGVPNVVAAGSLQDANLGKYIRITLDDDGNFAVGEVPIL